jgi:integrase
LDISTELRSRVFTEIHREDITALLDKVEDENGAPLADKVLTVIGSIMSWYAIRHRDYVPPLVKGMRRTDPKKKERDRVLDDDELRLVWNLAGQQRTYGALIRMLLLTGQRLDKVLRMRWDDVDADGVWIIPTEPREKTNIGKVRLPPDARAILDALPRFDSNPFIFTGRGQRHMSASGTFKAKFDAKLPSDMPPWRLHDLRRTARSLMSRAKVSSKDAERVMGHSLPGVEGVYDRYAYLDEKSDALQRLASLIDGIVHPRADVIVPMAKGNQFMPRKMSDKGVAKLKRRRKRYAKPDPELRGHWIRVQPSGTKSFWTVARDPKQKQVWTYVGPCDAMTIEEARAKARTERYC